MITTTSLLLSASALSGPRPALTKPNILLFFVDDLGYGDLGFTGHPSSRTPALDRLAAEGKRLTSWYSAYPVCTSSRTALLTGRQPPRVGMPGVINSLSAAGLPLSERTLANELQDRGYKTLALGKWHLGQQPEYLPTARGFDAFLGLPFSVDDGEGYAPPCHNASGADDNNTTSSNLRLGPSIALPLIHQDASMNSSRIVEQPTNLRLLTSRLVEMAKNFTSKHRAVPFFVYFAFGHVHTATPNVDPASNPYNGKQYASCTFAGKSRRGLFGDALAEVDAAVETLVGREAGWMQSLGLQENTLIIFTSDNGPSIRWGLAAGSPGIFTGQFATFSNGTSYTNTAKGSTWEGGIRMPAFANMLGTILPNSATAEVVSTMDVFPSLLRLIDGPSAPAPIAFDGKSSLYDLLFAPTGAKSAHAFLPFYNQPNISEPATQIFAARMGRYKVHWLTSPGLGGGRYATHAPHDRAPPNEVRAWDPPLIFDVEADPSEMLPLASADLPHNLLSALAAAKASYESRLAPRAIDPAFGFQWALCCGVGCSAPCKTCSCRDVPLPQP
jgi:arylsulfatase A-like enzyme